MTIEAVTNPWTRIHQSRGEPGQQTQAGGQAEPREKPPQSGRLIGAWRLAWRGDDFPAGSRARRAAWTDARCAWRNGIVEGDVPALRVCCRTTRGRSRFWIQSALSRPLWSEISNAAMGQRRRRRVSSSRSGRAGLLPGEWLPAGPHRCDSGCRRGGFPPCAQVRRGGAWTRLAGAGDYSPGIAAVGQRVRQLLEDAGRAHVPPLAAALRTIAAPRSGSGSGRGAPATWRSSSPRRRGPHRARCRRPHVSNACRTRDLAERLAGDWRQVGEVVAAHRRCILTTDPVLVTAAYRDGRLELDGQLREWGGRGRNSGGAHINGLLV